MVTRRPITVELDLDDVALLRDLCLRFKRLETKLPNGEFLIGHVLGCCS